MAAFWRDALGIDNDSAILTTVANDGCRFVFKRFEIGPFLSIHLVALRTMIVTQLLRVDGQVAVAASYPPAGGREKHEIAM